MQASWPDVNGNTVDWCGRQLRSSRVQNAEMGTHAVERVGLGRPDKRARQWSDRFSGPGLVRVDKCLQLALEDLAGR